MATPLLANCKISTARAQQDATTLVSGPATPVLTGEPAHVHPTRETAYLTLPDVALMSDYEIKVAPGSDVLDGDFVLGIFLKDGVTPWPGTNPADTFHVVLAYEGAPVLLPVRHVFVTRVRTGGLPT